jgi:hypothetical protein
MNSFKALVITQCFDTHCRPDSYFCKRRRENTNKLRRDFTKLTKDDKSILRVLKYSSETQTTLFSLSKKEEDTGAPYTVSGDFKFLNIRKNENIGTLMRIFEALKLRSEYETKLRRTSGIAEKKALTDSFQIQFESYNDLTKEPA